MAWRIHLKNPSLEGASHVAYNSCVTPATRKMGTGAEAVTLYEQGGEDWWYECDSFDPRLPAKLKGTVTKVTFLGAPPTDDVTPGLYETEFNPSGGLITAAVASVTENGDHLKVELVASSIDEAKLLWRKVLKNDDSIRTLAYRKKSAAA